MNRKHIKFLYSLDYRTLGDIALKEKDNTKNVYYDLETKEALVYPDSENEQLRPLYMRLLKNGRRINTELAKFIANSISYAMNTSDDKIQEDMIKRLENTT